MSYYLSAYTDISRYLALRFIVNRGIEAIMDVSGKPGVPTTWIAVSLIMGFSFMLLVEYYTGSDHSHALPLHEDAFDLGAISDNGTTDVRQEENGHDLSNFSASGSKKAIKLTMGLVVHSLADGFALGASAVSSESTAGKGSSRSELPLVIFFALLIHKGSANLRKILTSVCINEIL